MLEIEMHSPSFRTTRSVSAKRARSPDSPSERPTKRPSLAIASSEPASAFPHLSSRGSSRHSSEDLVQQAGDLSIESPLFAFGAIVPEIATMDEEGMLVDDEQVPEISRRPYLAPLRTHSDAFMQDSAQINYAATTSLFPPSINIQPATPELLSRTRPSTPVRDHDGMSISPTTSFSILGSPTSRKQQRFMMGPKANCEKCRLGVKGHWAHF
ncbi:hypothetical protein FB45DRAFT_912556 [Roridomyces roridus]|uniref:Uncharacterized protein n=1 Tax=Roridomyces roridus TaxID=1738132 RepID=A0AAD7FQP3_9AGAR|nr:hypothetical protein FB45DRAFT_912556 [Roridomyces roridus]